MNDVYQYKMLTATKCLLLFTYNTSYIRKLITGLLTFALLHPGATKTRDVYVRNILLRSEIIYSTQKESKQLINVGFLIIALQH